MNAYTFRCFHICSYHAFAGYLCFPGNKICKPFRFSKNKSNYIFYLLGNFHSCSYWIFNFCFYWPRFFAKKSKNLFFATVVGLFLAKFFAVVFFLVDDVRRLIQWVAGKLFFRNTEGAEMSDDGISRSVFLSWLGLAAGSTLFGSLVYGFSNKYNYQVKEISTCFDNLPSSFKGLKIVHFSDVHSGSFTNKECSNAWCGKNNG